MAHKLPLFLYLITKRRCEIVNLKEILARSWSYYLMLRLLLHNIDWLEKKTLSASFAKNDF